MGAVALRGAQLQTRDQPGEVAIAVAILDEHRQARAVVQRQLAADERADARVLRGPVEARRAVDAVAIDERQRRHLEPRGLAHERLRLLGAFEKRERGLRVQFDEDVFTGGGHLTGGPEMAPRPPIARGAPAEP